MLFQITCKMTENFYGMPPNMAVPATENMLLPSLKILADMEDKGKIMGGSFAGQAEGSFIGDFPSPAEASRFIQSLPFWSMFHWEIKSIISYKETVRDVEKGLESIKAMVH